MDAAKGRWTVCAFSLFHCIAAAFLAKTPCKAITLHIAQILFTGGKLAVEIIYMLTSCFIYFFVFHCLCIFLKTINIKPEMSLKGEIIYW